MCEGGEGENEPTSRKKDRKRVWRSFLKRHEHERRGRKGCSSTVKKNIKGEGGPLEQSLELMGFTASDPFLFTIPLGARLGTWRSAPPLVLLYVASETQE